MRKELLAVCLIILLILQVGCTEKLVIVAGEASYAEKGVIIKNQGEYFEVVLDYTSGLTHREMGAALARGILEVVPDYEALIDLYIAESLPKYQYKDSFFRIEDIKPQINPDYLEELDGMAEVFSGGTENGYKDKILSDEEVYLYNILPDVARGSQCSFVSVFGERSETKKTITGRNLDWYAGKLNQLPRIQAITTYKYEDRSICSIGYMGFMGILTGFNDSKVYAAVLDSSTGAPYVSLGKRSYPLDIRYALENEETLKDIANYLVDPSKHYAVNHLIALADPEESKILENNISGTGATGKRVKRDLRSADSELNKGITWGITDAVAAVNSFMLRGNFDNHTADKNNTKRWKNIKKELLKSGTTAGVDDIKRVISYDNGSPGTFVDSGDIYTQMTVQMIVFEPESLSLEVFFHPRNTRNTPNDPIFKKIEVFK
ncbi:MAG: hypothetical protein BWY74_03505 [Firmicutes bacterium ADurb.Bin419]|nr:MAG: hypothetical protein BWY74_03505 [Firmicutes bacterium ADurb.Bin419]